MRRNIIIHKLVRLRISIHSIGLVECQAAMDDDADRLQPQYRILLLNFIIVEYIYVNA